MRINIEIIFQIGSIFPIRALELTLKFLGEQNCLPKTWVYYSEKEKTLPTDYVLKHVREEGRLYFNIQSDNLKIQFGSVANYNHIFLTVQELRPNKLNNWDGLAEIFLREPGFVQAWLADIEYSSWQNAEEILEYELEERDYSHLPLTKRDLPPPLDEQIIDISGNPGRRILRMGYVEAVGATMWLGKPFWAMVGEERRTSILSADWVQTREMNNGVIWLQVASECFRDESNKDIQVKLRRTLYGVA